MLSLSLPQDTHCPWQGGLLKEAGTQTPSVSVAPWPRPRRAASPPGPQLPGIPALVQANTSGTSVLQYSNAHYPDRNPSSVNRQTLNRVIVSWALRLTKAWGSPGRSLVKGEVREVGIKLAAHPPIRGPDIPATLPLFTPPPRGQVLAWRPTAALRFWGKPHKTE